ncbi:MAG: VTT domain-containing protein [Methylotenera sp.]|uniref:VTT domain-containing protein n=1 Tax=Methylotenera sp. TaxID=2051956 RepID=UPI002487DE20|nr:VTT domain-containing protein [Methylotenera sp.]MDI1308848.1 VTT domain-containing protein [Methylotenera sp.]
MNDSIKKQENEPSHQESILTLRRNCWRIENSSFASPVVDCSNYYRAIHEAICKAQHSLFIVGWDIDSRIELIRGEEAEASKCPTTLFELLKWKSEQSPELSIYLNRWNYSIFLAAERETFSSMKWKMNGIQNLEFIFDDQLPLGASHHQKVIVVDDEIAFCGGMDIAIARWDNRQHHVKENKRRDPQGTLVLGFEKKYIPYHDAQMLVAGDAAQSLGELARKRWFLATGKHAKPPQPYDIKKIPSAWPDSVSPVLENARIGISLTMPRFREQHLDRGVEHLYLDMIEKAERFIYMENQFFTHREIAEALNKRLKEKPELRVLMLSCKDPQGFMERKTMYFGRVHFKDALTKDGVGDRVVMAYPISQENNAKEQVRVHSKVMIVDENYLRIGSSNLNYRSMTLDTECDLLVESTNNKTREGVASIRDDLIREHTGREVEDIERIICEGFSVKEFLQDVPTSRQHLREINDEAYRHEKFARFFTRFGDPSKPLLPSYLTSHRRIIKPKKLRHSKPFPMKLLVTILITLALIVAWKFTPLSEWADAENLASLLSNVSDSPWSLPVGILLYIAGTLMFFPHVVMTAAVVLVFAPIEAFLVAIISSLLSCSISYFLGLKLGKESLNAIFGQYSATICQYADKGGVMALTILRLLPIAPFTAVNMILGMIKVPYANLIISTFLGMLPGTILFIYLGKSAVELLKNPDPIKFILTGLGLITWIVLIWFTHLFTKRWRKKFDTND